LSAVILNRGGRYPRYGLFEELEKAGFDYVLSMESSFTRYDIEALSRSFPFVRFILLKEPVSRGEEINLAASELESPLFFVLWNDLKILRGGAAERMADRLLVSGGVQSSIPDTESRSDKSDYKRLCTVPIVQDGRSEIMPTIIAPAFIESAKNESPIMKTIPFIPRKEGIPTLYPFDGIGIYDRLRFIRMGGFDTSITNFYWQLMDFGFRSWLWGEEISSTQLIKLSYEGTVPLEDSTADLGALRFYLKNLAPVFRGDYAHIPLRRFLTYLKMRGDLASAWSEFRAGRTWVKTSRYRFTSDARTMAERFISIETGNSEASNSQTERDDIHGDET
jgi:hypothetical protein